MNLSMPLVTKSMTVGGIYVVNYDSFRTTVLNGAKIIVISVNMDQKRCLDLAMKALDNVHFP